MTNNTCLLSSGTTRSLILILKHLRGRYDFTVAAPCDSEGLRAALMDLEIPFRGLSSRRFDPARSLMDIAVRERYDLVYANNYGQVAQWAYWAAKLGRSRFIWHIRERVQRRELLRTVRWADAVIANSQYVASALISVAGVRSPTVVANGVDLQDFEADRMQARDAALRELALPPDSLVMVSVGNLGRIKNQLDAVEVTRQVCARHPGVRLICIGIPSLSGITYLDDLRTRIRQLELTGRVRLIGYRSNVVPYLLGADLLLHTSLRESQGRVTLEAMAAGLPVVAYRVGGIPEAVVEGETGLLVPSGDCAAAAQAVCRLVADPAFRAAMGAAGRARVTRHFTAEATARSVDDVISSVLSGRASRDGKGLRRHPVSRPMTGNSA